MNSDSKPGLSLSILRKLTALRTLSKPKSTHSSLSIDGPIKLNHHLRIKTPELGSRDDWCRCCEIVRIGDTHIQWRWYQPLSPGCYECWRITCSYIGSRVIFLYRTKHVIRAWVLSKRLRTLIVWLSIPRACRYRIIRILHTLNRLIDYVRYIQTSHISGWYIIRDEFHRYTKDRILLVILHLLNELSACREIICKVASPEITSAQTIGCHLDNEVHAPTIHSNIILLVKFQKLGTKLRLPGHGL